MKKRMCHGGSLLFITTLLLAFSCVRQEEDPIPGGSGRDVQFSAVSRPDADAARTRAEGIPDEEADAIVWIDWDGVSWVKEQEGCRQAPETRTAYSGKTYGNPKKERIDWVDGDRISIWCDQNQDSNTKMVDYAVTPSGNENEIDKGTITAIPPVGLRWSSEETHWFEGVYPGATTDVEKSFDSFEADGTDKLKFSFHIPESQTGTQSTAGDMTVIAPNMAYAPMAAKASGTKNGGTVTLTFSPVFTAFQITVRNRFADKTMTVKKIGIEYAGTNGPGLSGAGTWSMTRNADTDPGYAAGTPVTQKVEWSHSGLVLPKGTQKALRVTLLALPADLDAVNLYVETAESGLRKLPIKKNGSFYAFAGRKKYNINLGPLPDTPPSQFTITITQPEAFLHSGASVSGFPVRDTVRSYEGPVNNQGAKRPVPWKLQYSTDNGATWSDNRPANSWVTGITQTGTGSTDPDGESDIITVSKNSATTTGPTADEVLRSNPPVQGVYDLSTNGGTTKRYTANCYVVNARGTYRFPLVFGNAIKAGKPNPASYKASDDARAKANGDPYFLPEMWLDDNLSGLPITSPEIDTCLTDPDVNVVWGGSLEWQDAPGLISDIQVVSEHGYKMWSPNDSSRRYVQFTVGKNPSKLVQGNAVISVGGRIGRGWSWHIWITPYRLGDDLITVEADPGYEISGGQSATLPVPLGWCDYSGRPSSASTPGRSLLVRAVQTVPGGATSAPVTIAQNGHYLFKLDPASSETRSASCCYYQWGRKDPFPGSRQTPGDPSANANEMYSKPVYNIKGKEFKIGWQDDWRIGGRPNGRMYQMELTLNRFNPGNNFPSILCHSSTLDGSPSWNGPGGQRRNLWKINQVSKNPDYDSFLNRATDDFDRGKEMRDYGQKTVYDPCPAGYMVPPAGLLLRGRRNDAARTPQQRTYDYIIAKGYPKMRALVYGDPTPRCWFTKNGYRTSEPAYDILFAMWTSTSYGNDGGYAASITIPFPQPSGELSDWINDDFTKTGRQAFALPVFPGKCYDLEPAQ